MFERKGPTWATAVIEKEAQRHAMAVFPMEACGIVTRSRGYIPQENCAADPLNFFEMNPGVWIEYRGDILGVIHSHTNGNYAPGEMDMRSQISCGVAFGLLVATSDSASGILWWGADTPIPPLIGRQFLHGIQDCYSLIRDWYQLERGIVLREYPRDNEWWVKGENLYELFFRDAGFHVIPNDPNSIQSGDVFLSKVRSPVENHGGLYVGGGKVIHHVGGHISQEVGASPWIKLVTRWVRYGEKS
jgi:proteasome lid subunit RPN8/RPN11